MRTPKPKVSRPETVEGNGKVFAPTVRNRRVGRKAEAIVTAGPDGVRLDMLEGTHNARALVRLDSALLAARADTNNADLDYVLTSLNGYRPAPGEMMRLARGCAESYRRHHAESRGENTRARSFYRLAVALGLATAATPEDEPDAANALQRDLMRARRTMRAPRPE